MCLSVLRETYEKPLMETRIGYKSYYLNSGSLLPYSSQYGYNSGYLPTGKWLRSGSKGKQESTDSNKKYEPGFHIWDKLKSAAGYASSSRMLFKVEYREVVASGLNSTNVDGVFSGRKCLIARQMKIVAMVDKNGKVIKKY
jgi:hypothetical protein